MGSPYSVSISNRVHVIKSLRGYILLRKEILRSTGIPDINAVRYGSSPEGAMIHYFDVATHNAILQYRRTVVTLEARYNWTGSEKFGRVIVLDFSCSGGAWVQLSDLKTVSNNNTLNGFYLYHHNRLHGCEEGEDFKLFAQLREEIPFE